MIRGRFGPAILLALSCGGVLLAEPYDSSKRGTSEILLRAMNDEMRRSLEQIQLGGLPRPYFIAETVEEQHVLQLEGILGAITRPEGYSARMLRVDLRVGSRAFDDNHFVSAEAGAYAPLTAFLPVEDDYDALRFEIWSLTDQAYKRAVDRFAKKRAYQQSRSIKEEVPDLSEEEAVTRREIVAARAFDQPEWERRLRVASAVFLGYPRIQSSHVRLSLTAGHTYFVDSEGRSFVKPSHLFEIRIRATGLADDGMTQRDEWRLVTTSQAALPALDELKAAVVELAARVTALTLAPRAGSYLGPVLLEGQAAGEFFNQLLASGISGSRRLWVESDWAERFFRPGSLLGRVGMRITSPLLDVHDDPTVAELDGLPLVGHYDVDDQGIPARRVDLIRHGILEDVLMSRSPTPDRAHSNGHGRAGLREPVTASVGNLFVTASEAVQPSALKQRLREEARSFGLDRGMLIRRIADESERERDELISSPVSVYEVDVESGEERLLRDARFQAVTLRALRDIVAASSERHVYNLTKQGSAYFRGSLPVAMYVHPSVLLSEMELTETREEPDKPPYLAPYPAE